MDNDPVHLEGYFYLEHRDDHGHTWREYISVIKKYRFYYASKEGKMSNHVKLDYDTMLSGVFFNKNGADEYQAQYGTTDPVVARNKLAETLCAKIRAAEEEGRRYEALQTSMQLCILEGTGEKLLPRFYRIFSSVAADLYSSMQENLCIRNILKVAVEDGLWDQLTLCKEQFTKYKDRLFALAFTKARLLLTPAPFSMSHSPSQLP